MLRGEWVAWQERAVLDQLACTCGATRERVLTVVYAMSACPVSGVSHPDPLAWLASV